jgi:hypothetical protein
VYGVLTLIGTLPGAAVLIARRARSRPGVAGGEAGVADGEAGVARAANARQLATAIALPAMRAPLPVETATSATRPGGSRSRGRAHMGRTEQV